MKAYETLEIMRRRTRQIREAKGWRREDLAKRAGVSKTTIEELENGRVGGQLYTWVYIAEALGIDLADLCAPDGGGGSIEKKADH